MTGDDPARGFERVARGAGGTRTETAWAFAVVAVILLFATPLVLWDGRVFFLQDVGGSDLVDFSYPLRTVLLEGLRHGALPLWCPNIYGGFPLFSEGQIGALFPPNWIGPWSHPGRALTLSLVLTLVLAGLFAFRLARAVGLHPAASFVAAASWPLSGQFISHMVQPNLLAAVCFIPLALAALEESCREHRPRRLLWLAPILAMCVLAGYPPMAYLAGLALVASLASWWMPGTSREDRPRVGHVACLLAAVGLAGALALPQLLAMWELQGQSIRSRALGSAAAALGSLQPRMLLRWIYPWILGDVSRVGTAFPADGVFLWTHAGLLSVVALGLALFRVRKERMLLRPLALLCASVVCAMGRYTPMFSLLLMVPGFSLFRFPCRALFLSELVLALLTAEMLQWLWTRATRWGRMLIVGAGAAHLTGLMALAWPVIPTLPASDFPPPSPTATFLSHAPAGRIYTLYRHEAWVDAYIRAGGWRGDLEPFMRVTSLLTPNANLLYHMPSAQGYAALALQVPAFLTFGLWPQSVDLAHPRVALPGEVIGWLRRLAVRYVLSARPLVHPALTEIFRTAFDWGGFQIRIYTVSNTCPRARVIGRAVPPQEPLMRITGLDPAGTVSVEGVTQATGVAGVAGEARILAEESRQVLVDATATRQSWFVLADTFYPGWRAYLDGQEVSIWRADRLHRAVRLPEGRHRIWFVFDPPWLSRGVLGMVVGLLVWAALVFLPGIHFPRVLAHDRECPDTRRPLS